MPLFTWLSERSAMCTSCCITIAYVIMIVGLCSAGDVTPPTGVWCTDDAVYLGDSVPFEVPQPVFWKEYFIYNATASGTIGFKLYPGMPTDEYFTIIVGVNYCPNIVQAANRTSAYSHGTVEVMVDVDEGNTYVIFAHLPGANFTVVGCDGPCPMACPNDCTNLQGICDLTDGKCICNPGWVGDNCSIVYVNNTNGTTPLVHHHTKVPFGSKPVFISVVAGVPAAVIVAGISAFFMFRAYRKKEQKLKRNEEKEPLIIPYANGVNGHRSYNNGNSLPAYTDFQPAPNGDANHHTNGFEHAANGDYANRYDSPYSTSEDFGLNRRSRNYDK